MKKLLMILGGCFTILMSSCSEDGNTERDKDFDTIEGTAPGGNRSDTLNQTAMPSDTSGGKSLLAPGSDNPTSKDIQGQPYQSEPDTLDKRSKR